MAPSGAAGRGGALGGTLAVGHPPALLSARGENLREAWCMRTGARILRDNSAGASSPPHRWQDASHQSSAPLSRVGTQPSLPGQRSPGESGEASTCLTHSQPATPRSPGALQADQACGSLHLPSAPCPGERPGEQPRGLQFTPQPSQNKNNTGIPNKQRLNAPLPAGCRKSPADGG